LQALGMDGWRVRRACGRRRVQDAVGDFFQCFAVNAADKRAAAGRERRARIVGGEARIREQLGCGRVEDRVGQFHLAGDRAQRPQDRSLDADEGVGSVDQK
jgi:hypothetical protein